MCAFYLDGSLLLCVLSPRLGSLASVVFSRALARSGTVCFLVIWLALDRCGFIGRGSLSFGVFSMSVARSGAMCFRSVWLARILCVFRFDGSL